MWPGPTAHWELDGLWPSRPPTSEASFVGEMVGVGALLSLFHELCLRVHFEKGMGRPTVGPAVPKTSMQIVDSAFLLSMDHLFPLAHFIFLFFLSYFFHCLPFLSFFSPPSLLSFFQFISTTGLFNISFRTLTTFFLKVAYVC